MQDFTMEMYQHPRLQTGWGLQLVTELESGNYTFPEPKSTIHYYILKSFSTFTSDGNL